MAVKTTNIKWRRVNAEEALRNGIYCMDGCEGFARWCRQWQTSAMSAPAFWYFCESDATIHSSADGISLA
jgi:hypothetical protein